MKMDYANKLQLQGIGCLGVGILLIGGLIGYAMYEDAKFETFATEHDCKVIGQTDEKYGYGTVNGKMGAVIIPATKTYKCNDGVNYTR